MEQRYGTDPSRRYGTGVGNGGIERVWSRSLFRTSYFDFQTTFRCKRADIKLCSHHSAVGLVRLFVCTFILQIPFVCATGAALENPVQPSLRLKRGRRSA